MKDRSHDESELNPPSTANARANVSDQASSETLDDITGLVRAGCWLNLERLARVELGVKEDATEFVACALSQTVGRSWRAQDPGPQTIRLVFAAPQSIDKVRLVFVEEEFERTQEWVLRWLPQGAAVYQEIVRQQYNFSPRGSRREVEEYQVNLRNVQAVELSIFPNISNCSAFASLAHWALGSPISVPEEIPSCDSSA